MQCEHSAHCSTSIELLPQCSYMELALSIPKVFEQLMAQLLTLNKGNIHANIEYRGLDLLHLRERCHSAKSCQALFQ